MIENIYSQSEQGNRKKETSKLYKIPKNIRQVGQPQDNPKIYAEDYVITFIRQLAEENTNAYQMAILLGEPVLINEMQYIFIRGAVEVNNVSTEEELLLDQSTWSEIYEEIKKYFSEVEIVGWMLTKSGISWEEGERFKKIHIDNFSGQDKVFLTYDPIEKEENFFLYKSGNLTKQRGYYIYYERNVEMQNYLVERHKGAGVESNEDNATKSVRDVMEKKQQKKLEKKGKSGWYTLGGAVAAAFILAGAYAVNNPEQWEQIRQTMSGVTTQWLAPTENNNETVNGEKGNKNSTPVEMSSGNVTTIKQETVVGDRTQKEGSKDIKEDKDKGDNTSGEAIGEKEEMGTSTKAPNDTQENKGKKEGALKSGENVDEVMAAINKNNENLSNGVQTETKNYYVVQKGDSLASISMRLYKTLKKVEILQELNNIDNPDEIYIGQKIVLP